MHQIPPLFFQKYRFSLEVTSPMLLPEYKGSTFRGGILTAFKYAVCRMPHGQCEICPLTAHCSYYALFEPQPAISRLGIPMPYIIEPPLTKRRMFDAGDTLEFSVILVGKMTTYWKLLVFAVEGLGQTAGIGRRVDGRRGRFRLKRVDSIGLNGNTVTVYSDTDEFGHAPPITVTSEEVEQIAHSIERENRATRNTQGAIHFITPVCFIENVKDDSSVTQKRLVTDLNFTRLMRELGRRLGSLSEAYCDGHRPKLSELFDDAATIRSVGDFAPQEFERYSRRQRARHPVRGIIGALRVEGDLTPFLPYLRLGEWLHVGKLTTFGLGRYWVES